MSLVIEKFLLCDFCGESYGVDTRQFNTLKNLRQDSRQEGWIFYAGRDYCPMCKEERRKDE